MARVGSAGKLRDWLSPRRARRRDGEGSGTNQREGRESGSQSAQSAGRMAAAEAAAAATLERLEALSCPPVLGGPPRAPPAALELLCRPSPPRRALLRWACTRVHPPLSAELESLPEEDEMRALARLGAQLMLCRADDLALVEGTAPPEQQLQFLQDLLDAVPPLETPPKTRPPQTTQFLLKLLETPEGGAALRPPPPPPVPVELSETPPRPRRPLPELEAELGGVRRGLEELQAQLSNLGGSPAPSPPNLGVLVGTLTSLAADFGASELRGPLAPPRTPQIWGEGGRVPPVGRGLRNLSQVLGTLTQLGASAGEVTRLGGVTEAIEPQIPPLSQRFQPPRCGRTWRPQV
ncbi:HAUS augmin-like complex subunit 7 isoform X1 [Taeniopygia guttata]|uniref:HAUS augmin-like complex subunit 7 isoform X1 n=1 Tax=Taeniopygia guttata TaxID=59729 RepID=UPI003BB9303E